MSYNINYSRVLKYSSSLAGENGEVITVPGGRIDIQHKTKFAPRTQSVIDFVVDEDKRGNKLGDQLLKKALEKYTDLGGQVSSPASLKVFHNNGFRNPELGSAATFKDHLDAFAKEGGSLYMALKDENGVPYVSSNP